MRLFALALALTAAALTAHSQDIHVRVDPHGPGSIASTTDYTTIQQAFDHAPQAAAPFRTLIEITPGIYHERIDVTRNRPRITLLGLGHSPQDVLITNSLNAKQAGGTFLTATADIEGDDFAADNITFENSAGNTGVPGELARGGVNTGQAVAAAVRSDRAVFKHCRFLGDQDTLFADFGRQYYVDSYIAGGVDFIFGNAAAVFDHDEIHAIRPGYLTAQSRTAPDQPTGYVIDHSRVTFGMVPVLDKAPLFPDPSHPFENRDNNNNGAPPIAHSAIASGASRQASFFLGRPWRPYSRVIVMNTKLPSDLNPAGWSKWNRNDPATPSAFYAEFHNTGPGANTSQRVPWSHQLTAHEAAAFEPQNFLRGSDNWNPLAEAAKLP